MPGGRDSVLSLQAKIDDLQWRLEKTEESAVWWKQEARRLKQCLTDEPSTWCFCRVTSPLTTLEQWCSGMSDEGWGWHHFEVFCPCCKRPLDVTVLRSNRPSGNSTEGAGVATATAGTKLTCIYLPPGSDRTPIYNKYYDIIRELAVGDIVVAAGRMQRIKGYSMVPIHPCGAVDARFFEVPKGAEEDTRPVGFELAPQGVTKVAEEDTRPAGFELAPQGVTAPPMCRLAYCAVIWGTNGGYALGASVLGSRLKELSARVLAGGEAAEGDAAAGGGGRRLPDRVLLHTDDVPRNFLEVLGQVWTLRQVDYIDGVEDLYNMKGTAFDGVFTKLAAWGLTEYDRVLLLDIDLVPLRAPLELFDLTPPAALIRGNGDLPHGSAVDGRRFFCGEADAPYTWGQGGGINAGVILLRPSKETLERMKQEVTSEEHPEHIHGSGPEQDYLTRYFASAPWHHMDVRWNYQVHHLPFALEQVLGWRRHLLEADRWVSEAEHGWLPSRLRTELESIGIVHFSGDVKPWHMVLDAVQDNNQRRAVDHVPSTWRERKIDDFGDHLLKRCCKRYECWLSRTAPAADFAELGCELLEGGRIELVAGGGEGAPERREDVTAIVDAAAERIRGTTQMALAEWRSAAERFLASAPDALAKLCRLAAPAGCFPPGARVEVLWPPPEEALGGQLPRFFTAMVVSVHADGRHVVRFHHGGPWGDTERGVTLDRLRTDPATLDQG